MAATGQDSKPQSRPGVLWAWAVAFVVTLGLHVGIVVFTTLWVALAIYSIAAMLANTSLGIRAIAWLFTVISLLLWAQLVKQQILAFQPHVIRGLGRIAVASSGAGRGQIAADLGAGAIGLAQIVPLVLSLLGGQVLPEQTQVLTALVGGLFVVLGGGSLALRLSLRRRRDKSAEQA